MAAQRAGGIRTALGLWRASQIGRGRIKRYALVAGGLVRGAGLFGLQRCADRQYQAQAQGCQQGTDGAGHGRLQGGTMSASAYCLHGALSALSLGEPGLDWGNVSILSRCPGRVMLAMSPICSRILVLLLVWPLFAWAEGSAVPMRPLYTAEQQAWLAEHRQLRVGLLMQAPWALYDRRLQRLSGANVELMTRVLQGMGAQPVWLRYADQDELDNALRRGEVDLAPGLQQTPRGLRLWLYSAPYMRVPHLVVSEQRGISAVDLDRLGHDELVAVREPSPVFEYLYKTHNN